MTRPLLALLLLSLALLACATTATVAELPAVPTLAPKSPTIAPVAILKGDWVCRTEPTEASSRCGWFLDGQKVTVLDQYKGWVLVRGGWVCGRGLPSLDVKECE